MNTRVDICLHNMQTYVHTCVHLDMPKVDCTHYNMHTCSIVCSLKLTLVSVLLFIIQLSGAAEFVLDASQAQKGRNQHSAIPHQDGAGQASRHRRTGG